MLNKIIKKSITLFLTITCLASMLNFVIADNGSREPFEYNDVQHYFTDIEYNYEYEDEDVYLTHYIDEIYIFYTKMGSTTVDATIYTSQYHKENKGFLEKYEIVSLEYYGENTFPYSEYWYTTIFKENNDVTVLKYLESNDLLNGVIAIPDSENEEYTFEINRGGIVYFYDRETVTIGTDAFGSRYYLEVMQIEYKTKKGKEIKAYDYSDAVNMRNVEDSISNDKEQNIYVIKDNYYLVTVLIITSIILLTIAVIAFLIKISKKIKGNKKQKR